MEIRRTPGATAPCRRGRGKATRRSLELLLESPETGLTYHRWASRRAMLVRRYASLTARLPASEATTPRARVCAASGALPMTTGLTVRRALGSAALLAHAAVPAWSDTGLDRAARGGGRCSGRA